MWGTRWAAQLSPQGVDRIVSSQLREGNCHWESEASRAAGHNASGVVAASTRVGDEAVKPEPHSSVGRPVGVWKPRCRCHSEESRRWWWVGGHKLHGGGFVR
eukprot:364771-Chlamydomonas_euryale.AAC.2